MTSIAGLVTLASIFNLGFLGFVNGISNKNIPLEYIEACGLPGIPKLIDKRYFRCDDGRIVSITTPSIPSTPTSSGHVSTNPPATHKNNGICSYTDSFFCNKRPQCGAERGYQCCGFERYHPGFQTCCQISSAKYRIHNDKPEKEHVCCHLKVYKRGSEYLPCEHPSSNDKFSHKLTSLKGLKREQTRCDMETQDTLFLYKIDIRSKGNETRPKHRATVSMWPLRSLSTTRAGIDPTVPSKSSSMEIPSDKYSRIKKNLVGRSYFTISTKNYLGNAVFFLNPSDNLYQWPKRNKKQRRVRKMLNKIKRRCNRQKSRSRKRTSHKT